MTRTVHADALPALDGPWCFYINPTQDPAEHGGYVPSVVEHGKPGHWPMMGRDELAQPWVWGATLKEAEVACEEMNAEHGMSKLDAIKIVLSSMGAGMSGRRA